MREGAGEDWIIKRFFTVNRHLYICLNFATSQGGSSSFISKNQKIETKHILRTSTRRRVIWSLAATMKVCGSNLGTTSFFGENLFQFSGLFSFKIKLIGSNSSYGNTHPGLADGKNK